MLPHPEQKMVSLRHSVSGRADISEQSAARFMKPAAFYRSTFAIPAILLLGTLIALALLYKSGPTQNLLLRVPGNDRPPGFEAADKLNPVLNGHVTIGDGQAFANAGAWNGFRGSGRDGKSLESNSLARAWANGEPRQLWAIDVGEGYAGAAVLNGRVYLMDYDQVKKQDALRCLSLSDGKEIWRFAYRNPVKRNHGMSRTVPAVTEKCVVAIGPKCHVLCLNSVTGELYWGIDMVHDYGTAIPPWYAGQCPLVVDGQLILAPAGKDALLVALDLQSGKELWRTPNVNGWKMTHTSVMPLISGDERMLVYCANQGVVGVSAKDGHVLWETREWKISLATVPSPLILENGHIFVAGGYNAGSLMLNLKKSVDGYKAETLFRLPPEVFGASQHTPFAYKGSLYGVRPDGKFICLNSEGKVCWVSEGSQNFGLGSFILADGIIYAMNDSGLLRMILATAEKYTLLAQSQVLNGRESWGPLAIADGRLLVRDLTRLVCLDVAKH
jgi:outer membrane protein assembly factor BamB